MSSVFEIRKFLAPEIVFGVGSRKMAGRYLLNFGARKVLIVTDKSLRETTPWVQELEGNISAANLPYVVFDNITPNPRAKEVMEGAELFVSTKCNAIVAIGGGSPMDCAKGIGIVSTNGGFITDFEGVDRIKQAMPPLLCIPSTSGTASEVSQVAVVLDEIRKTKIGIVSKAVVPDAALVDPEVTLTMDDYLTACTGMDAFTHAIEAYVSNASSPLTDLHAKEAIRLIWNSLERAVKEPEDLYWRSEMLLGSLQAGLAFSNAILGIVHAMAHSLGGYLDLAHGECNAILLPTAIEFNYRACPDRFKDIAGIIGVQLEGLGEYKAAQKLADEVKAFSKRIGISKSLADLGVEKSVLPTLATMALKDACLATNPRSASAKDVINLYEKAL